MSPLPYDVYLSPILPRVSYVLFPYRALTPRARWREKGLRGYDVKIEEPCARQE